MFIAPQHIRTDRLIGNDYENNGVSGINQAKSSPEVGRALMQIKVDNALAQIKRDEQRRGRAGAGRCRSKAAAVAARRHAAAAAEAAGPPQPTMLTAPAGKTPTRRPTRCSSTS